jgi:hypothetical protein
MHFDIIGDIHGQHHKLSALLRHLGYRESQGTWRCAGRTAVFVGDLIDRGPAQVDTVELVRRMVDAGSAFCVMGNHEFNAIAWTVPNAQNPAEFLRSHTKPGNLSMHRIFLDAVEGTARHAEYINWFMTLPLWLDLGGIRIVHACWHEQSIERLAPIMGPGNTLTPELFAHGSFIADWAFRAIETICKGPEVNLPAGAHYTDKEGRIRSEVRVRWWESDLSTFRKAAIGPLGDMAMIPDAPMPEDWRLPVTTGAPVVFGHYWFNGQPQVISDQFACIDYSAATTGPLVAYRWDGETTLSSDKLSWVG